ncbi:hypothetical protein ASPWEDRAFT_41582 [Aspergillus wentii DTO 134E9]|uniref:Hydrophobin n=1 Tax=Aspergillus wentii DTO 134E9 TaxID=1073089 RepID=A0A1L9RFM8_ASPWE|nr:uncharacterized protein ASPWEDRAFT_41582 [Aspergillus wentii DTO 134E9]KAI9925490.1 hypothetical protein MW887_005871 [Aspergillus wentii]OJJ33725.1 hypothetical protein ASPWEDRAFT_41582 [Aspergillus wentii DTO 134E9]
MRLLTLFSLVAAASSEFTCIKPINPIPAGPPGLCCKEIVQAPVLTFLYTGKTCTHANKISEADNGKTTYSSCEDGEHAVCCDPLVTKLSQASNPACVLPESEA